LCGQDCPLLDSRLRGNDIVGVASTAPHPELVEGQGFQGRAGNPLMDRRAPLTRAMMAQL